MHGQVSAAQVHTARAGLDSEDPHLREWRVEDGHPLAMDHGKSARSGAPAEAPTPDPKPPTPEEATAIVNDAFKDLPWGMLVWLAMTTGARRGELCALRWDWLDLDNATLRMHTSIAQDGGKTWEKETKTHQQRRITLDPETVGLLRAYRQHCDTEARSVGARVAKDGRLFSPAVDHTTFCAGAMSVNQPNMASRNAGPGASSCSHGCSSPRRRSSNSAVRTAGRTPLPPPRPAAGTGCR